MRSPSLNQVLYITNIARLVARLVNWRTTWQSRNCWELFPLICLPIALCWLYGRLRSPLLLGKLKYCTVRFTGTEHDHSLLNFHRWLFFLLWLRIIPFAHAFPYRKCRYALEWIVALHVVVEGELCRNAFCFCFWSLTSKHFSSFNMKLWSTWS